MAPISLKKGIIDKVAGELVIYILNIGKDEPNFKLASEYVMSNLRFHRFLDVNPLEVSRSLKGLCSKFRVNVQDKKAVRLENLVENFVNQSLIERKGDEKEIQTDVHYSLLSLMLNLSNNPLKSEFIDKGDDTIKETENIAFDWNTYLLSGEERLGIGVDIDDEDEKQLYDSDDEFWDLTDDEFDNIYDHGAVESDSDKIVETTEVLKESEHIQTFDVTWIYKNVVPSYWTDSEPLSFKINDATYSAGYSNICKNWEIYKRETEGQCRVHSYKLLTERQLVMETLWMLQGIESLYVYKFEDGNYIPNENVAVTHLTEETLKAYLTMFTSIGDKVVRLKKYSEQVLDGVESVSKSFRAFGYVLGRYLIGRCAFLADLEKTWINKDQTMTLSVLKGCLESDKKYVECIHQLYIQAVCTGLTLYSTETERLVYFMDVFYKQLCMFDSLGEAGKGEFAMLLPMFLDICQPYLNDMDNWMTMGQLPTAGDEEFMIYMAKDIEKGESDYWLKTYKIKETKDTGNDISTLVPIFVQGMQKQILLAGKSLGLLAEFGNYATNISSTKCLYDEFKDNLKTRLQEVNEQPLKCSENLEDEVDGHPTAYIDDPEIDPLLKENFKLMFLDVYKSVCHEKRNDGNVCRSSQPNEWVIKLIKDAAFRPPIRLLVEQCLFPVITKRYKEACAFLLEFFKTEFKLFDHLKVMGNFFLMQAGGTIHAFLSELFDMAKRMVYWQDVAYLNIVLQDALQLNFPNMIESLKVELLSLEKRSSAQLFDGLSLRYNAPWPITIILDVKTELQYNEIFKFLLKVKRAIWVLEQLRFYELIVPPGTSFEDQISSEDEEAEELPSPRKKMVRDDIILDPLKQKLKLRLVILRMKMLHALHNFHFYLMTRITHAINVELEPKVKDAKDLGEILEVHYMFLRNLKKRCFLHENIGRSKEAIFRILSLVFDFELLWLSNIDNIDPKRLDIIDNDFHRCKVFLHSFFSTLGKRGSYPHFEFLAHSLKS